jgi:hypothetical protein
VHAQKNVKQQKVAQMKLLMKKKNAKHVQKIYENCVLAKQFAEMV